MKAVSTNNCKECVDKVLSYLGNTIIIATPLGIGKPNHLINAFYKRALRDSSIDLTIITALTLELPKGSSFLEKRFLGPFTERVFGDYPDLFYEIDRVREKIPDNIKVVEFYFPAGKFIHNEYAQRNYMSSNYTHCARDMMDMGVNLILQSVAEDCDDGSDNLSLSSNADVTLDLYKMLKAKNSKFMAIAQINNNLPYMYGDAIVPPQMFNLILKNEELEYKLFGPPKNSIPLTDYLIGFYSSTLIKDGGELQIGIGNLGDTITYFLLLRQHDNDVYLDLYNQLEVDKKFSSNISRIGELTPFTKGLFAATEMLIDGFIELFDGGILKRKVYDNIHIQSLLNQNKISENFDDRILDYLLDRKAISYFLTEKDFKFLKDFGIFKEELNYRDGYIYLHDGEKISADLNEDEVFNKVKKLCLGTSLKRGAVIHGGFFLGPTSFYSRLKNMKKEERKTIHMKSVNAINQLYGDEELNRLHRIDARFVNTCLMVTLLGSVVSDGLDDGVIVSGVGGQYNFVSMAHALPDGRSIIQLRSTRVKDGQVFSNIVWNYGHTTIPRHLRDVIVTEYGHAVLRGKTDEGVVIELLKITDSRFQEELILKAKRHGKLRDNFVLPDQYRNNFPEAIKFTLQDYIREDLFPAFPFGHSFTENELRIGKALKWLKNNQVSKVKLILKAYLINSEQVKTVPKELLTEMKLNKVNGFKERLYKKLFILAYIETQ